MLKKIRTSELFLFNMRKEISYLQEAMQCSIITGANEIPRDLTYIYFFAVNSVIYHVAIAMMVISNVKITGYFHVRRYHVFTRKLTWYFIGGCITRQNLCRRLQFEEQEQL